MTPDEYGTYLLAVATVGLLGSWTVGWITPSLVRFYPQYAHSSDAHDFHSTWLGLGTRTVLVVTALLVLSFAAWPIGFSRDQALLLIAVFATDSIILLFTAFLRASRCLGWYLGVILWTSAGRLALGITLLAVVGEGARDLLLGWLIANLLAVPVLLYQLSPLPAAAIYRSRISPAIAGEIRRYGIPAVGTVLLVLVLSIADRYVLGIVRGPGEVALYAAGYEFSERSLFQLISIITMAGGPLMFETLERDGVDRSRGVLHDLASYFLLVGVPATVGLWVLAKPIVQVLLPIQYADAYQVVRPVALGGFLWGVMHSYMYALSLFKRSDLQALSLAPAAVFNVVMNLALAPRFGFVACAWVTLGSYGMALVTTALVSRRFVRWSFPLRSLVISSAASLIMALVSSGIVSSLASRPVVGLITAIVGGMMSYVGVLLLFNTVPQLSLRHSIATVRAPSA